MLKNYFTVAWRNLTKNKVFSFINIFGLALGLSVCFLITLFVLDELSYDRFNKKSDRIYRINAHEHLDDLTYDMSWSPVLMGPALKQQYPEIETFVRLRSIGEHQVKKDRQIFIEKNFFVADSTIFDVFTIPILAGNTSTALSQPNSIVISESIAQKYFHSVDVLGKTLRIDDIDLCQVTGVIKDLPAQSHLHFNFIRPLFRSHAFISKPWTSDALDTYLLVRSGVSRDRLNRMLKAIVNKYIVPEFKTRLHQDLNRLRNSGVEYQYEAFPLTKIHLYSTLSSEIEPQGSITYVYIFSIIAAFILLIACVNFVNLSTASALNRAKEIGVKKVMGSGRYELIRQFLFEAVLNSLLACLIAVVLVCMLIPFINGIVGKQISINKDLALATCFSLFIFAVIIGLTSGIYPAFYLSSFQPVLVLKNKVGFGSKSSIFRDSLVVFQFTTAIFLIIVTLAINNQLNFIHTKAIGYNREQLLILKNVSGLFENRDAFRNEVLKISGVESFTRAHDFPTSNVYEHNRSPYSTSPVATQTNTIGFTNWFIDENYIPTLQMKMAGGRNFSFQIPSDSDAVIINETAAAQLAFKDPLKARLYQSNDGPLQIIGVVKDFNSGSMRHQTSPLIFHLAHYENSNIGIRIRSGNIAAVVSKIKSIYHGFQGMAGQPFLYSFMDEDFNKLYESDQRTAKLFLVFAFQAILLACLGLFGLITYATHHRTKEIGIRKVLGASVRGILALFIKDFVKLILISALVAFPMGWFAVSRWLNDFAYRTTIGWTIFALAGGMAMLIAILTISFQSIGAAMANPVNSLRIE